jgi:predicted CXXCH cytochrome family protein
MPFILFVAASIFSFPDISLEAADYSIDKHHAGCIMCHRTLTAAYDASAVAAGDSDMSLICMDCHDYSENHHPVNFVPERTIYNGFPLIDGQIKCLTCHEAHGKKQPSYPKMLRGAPFTDRREMCFRCHSMDQNTYLNPHVMFDAEGKIRQAHNGPVCLV